MNIVFFTRRFYPHIGGVEKHVMEIGKRLVKMGHHVIIVTEKAGVETSQEHTINGIKIHRIEGGRDDKLKKLRIWKKIWRLKNVIEKADVVHCHDVFYWYLPFRLAFPTKPVYTTFHGYEGYPITQKAVRMRKLSEKLSWGNICIGDFMKKWYGTKPTIVSYGAVVLKRNVIPDSDRGSMDSRTHSGIRDLRGNDNKRKKDSAIFVGRLDDQTGILTYVKSVELLRKKYPKFELFVVGDGEYKELIEKKVTVKGFRNNPEKYFSEYHFAFVSRYLSILEAFAAKQLVFAVYDNPIKEDYLRMAPYAKNIIIEKDAKRLAEKVDYFIKHPEKEKLLVEDAYNWVKEQSWEKMVKLYLQLWEKRT